MGRSPAVGQRSGGGAGRGGGRAGRRGRRRPMLPTLIPTAFQFRTPRLLDEFILINSIYEYGFKPTHLNKHFVRGVPVKTACFDAFVTPHCCDDVSNQKHIPPVQIAMDIIISIIIQVR